MVKNNRPFKALNKEQIRYINDLSFYKSDHFKPKTNITQ